MEPFDDFPMHDEIPFPNRQEAGEHLADVLSDYEDQEPIVLALPRGGVPVAFPIARRLHAELDVALVRKLGAPNYPEVGIGAVVDGHDPQIVLNEYIIKAVHAPQSYIQDEIKRQLEEIERRRKIYRGSRPAPSLRDRTVILVDDGVATGGTVKVAMRALRKTGLARLILAIPVAPASILAELHAECDVLICLHAPAQFSAVGAYFRDFAQNTDAEIVDLLAAARSFAGAESGQSKVRDGAPHLRH